MRVSAPTLSAQSLYISHFYDLRKNGLFRLKVRVYWRAGIPVVGRSFRRSERCKERRLKAGSWDENIGLRRLGKELMVGWKKMGKMGGKWSLLLEVRFRLGRVLGKLVMTVGDGKCAAK